MQQDSKLTNTVHIAFPFAPVDFVNAAKASTIWSTCFCEEFERSAVEPHTYRFPTTVTVLTRKVLEKLYALKFKEIHGLQRGFT